MLSLPCCAGGGAARCIGGPPLSHLDIAALRPAASAAGIAAPVTASAQPVSGDALLSLILSSLEDDKAEAIVPIPLRGRSTIADHMVVCSGRSARQVGAIADKLLERLKERAGILARVEGKAAGDWVLVDAGDVIVHIFRPEVREFYQLEKMWLPSAAAAARPAAPAAGPAAGA
jgi:ribosome-associated protein